MKKLVQVQEIDGEGLTALLGQKVVIFCMNYIYSGTLTGVNTHDILLTDGGIVYETGAFTDSKFKDFQKVSKDLYIRTSAIESYSVTDKS